VVAAENAISQARGVYRHEAAGWLRLRDLQKAPRLGGHPGALAGRPEKGSNRVRPSTESSPPARIPFRTIF